MWPQGSQKLWLRFLKMFQCKRKQLHMNHSFLSLQSLLYKKIQSLENVEEAMMRILKHNGRIFSTDLEKRSQINQAKAYKSEEGLKNKKTSGTVILLQIRRRKLHAIIILKILRSQFCKKISRLECIQLRLTLLIPKKIPLEI